MGSNDQFKTPAEQASGTVPMKELTNDSTTDAKSFVGFTWHKVAEWVSLAIASGLAFWFLTARLAGVTVSVLIDEYVYVLDAHYKAFAESSHPNHLFQLIYSTTKACGPNFYECARGINAIFVVASALVIYLLAVQISNSRVLGAIAWAVAIFGTFGTYTAYFMPEAIFNFFMVLFIFCLIRFGSSDRLLVWLGLGVVLGVAALAKPHALFVVPAFVIYVFLLGWSTKQRFLKLSVIRIAALLSALATTKLGVGYLIAGPSGLSLFGSYGSAISSAEAVAQTLGANTWLNVPQTALGQTLMIVMILGIALPVSLVGLMRTLGKNQEHSSANKFRALFGIALLNMVAVSAVFEAWLNLTTWMHTRYYSYLIPLAVVVLVEAYSNRYLERTNLIKRIVVSVFVVLSIYALFTQAIPFGANWIDAPDFAAHIKNIEISSILIILAIVLSVFWLWDSKVPIAVAIGVSLLASGFAGSHISSFLGDSFGRNDTYQQTGRLLSNYLPQAELDKTVLFGTDGTRMQRALFYSLSGGAKELGGTHVDFDGENLDPDTKWLLVYGDPLPQLGQPHLIGLGYQLYSVGGETTGVPRNNELKSFSNPCLDQALASWVCGTESALEVNGLFPAKAKVDLVFDVGDRLAGLELEFGLGEEKFVAKVPAGIFAVSLSFQNASETNQLVVKSAPMAPGPVGLEQQMIRVVSINVE